MNTAKPTRAGVRAGESPAPPLTEFCQTRLGSEHQLQRELNDSARFAGLNDRLRARRGGRRATALSEGRAEDARRTGTGAHRMIEIRLGWTLETLSHQMHFEPFRSLENLW